MSNYDYDMYIYIGVLRWPHHDSGKRAKAWIWCPSVCLTIGVNHRRPGSWCTGFLRLILHYLVIKFGYFQ